MDATERKRLAAILGMLGSNHAGERSVAGLQAEAFRRKLGLTWAELLALQPTTESAPPPSEPPPHQPKPAPKSTTATSLKVRWNPFGNPGFPVLGLIFWGGCIWWGLTVLGYWARGH